MNKEIKNIQMFSTGGAGSHWFFHELKGPKYASPHLNSLVYEIEGHPEGSSYKHRNQPPQKLHKPNSLVLYLYCNPLNHALGMYKKKQARGHCEQMGGDVAGIQGVKTFEEFVENGVDYFKYYTHLSNWLNTETEYPRVLIKYEHIKEEFDNFCRLIEIGSGPPLNFRQRKSDYNKYSDSIKDKLHKMFKRELELYNSIPPLTVVK